MAVTDSLVDKEPSGLSPSGLSVGPPTSWDRAVAGKRRLPGLAPARKAITITDETAQPPKLLGDATLVAEE